MFFIAGLEIRLYPHQKTYILTTFPHHVLSVCFCIYFSLSHESVYLVTLSVFLFPL